MLRTSLALAALATLGHAQVCPTILELEPGFNPVGGKISGTTGSAESTGLAYFSDNLPLVEYLGGHYFVASDETLGGNLWTTDLSVSGTLKVGSTGGIFGSAIDELTVYGGRLYFAATGIGTGSELWTSDGTQAGMALVADLRPGPFGSSPRGFEVVNGRLLFAAQTSIGLEPWAFEPVGGALPLTDAGPGAANGVFAEPGYTTRVFAPNDAGTEALFWRPGVTGAELWKTDGTPLGTQLVQAFDAAPQGWPFAGAADGFVWWQGVWYFEGWRADLGFELWRSDGTPVGTTPLADLVPGPGSSDVRVEFATAFAGALHFVVDDGVHGAELWRTDGSAAGTQLVVDLQPGPLGARPDELMPFAGALYFVASTSATGRELWRIDAAGQAMLVADVAQGTADGLRERENELVESGGRLYFTASSPAAGRELWWTAGVGASLAADLVPGFQDADPDWLTPLPGGDVLFEAREPSVGRELWRSDGTPAGTALVANIGPEIQPLSSAPQLGKPLGDKLFVRGQTELHGAEPFLLDATALTVELVRDIRPGPFGSLLSQAVAFEEEHAFLDGSLRTYFAATTDEGGREVWRSDGTEAGTELLFDGPFDSQPEDLTFGGGLLFYQAVDSDAEGPELFVSDGTAAGTGMLGAFVPGPTGGLPRNFVSLGERVVFTANVAGLGGEPWVTDGTVAGTTLLKDINTGPLGSVTGESLRVGERVFFSATSPGNGYELWATDGTTPGTRRLSDIGPGSASGAPGFYAVANGFLFFGATGPNVGFELWQLDLATNEVRLAADLWPGAQSSNASQVTAGQSGLFVVGNSPVTGILEGSLFHLPYTATGVGAPTDVVAGLTVRDLDDLAAAGRGVFFSAHETASGRELYYTDGTPAGTARVCPSTNDSNPRDLTVVDGQLFYSGSSPSTGNEVFHVDLGLASAVPLTPARNRTTLHMTPPVLGATAHVDLHGAPPGSVNLLLLSPPVAAPLPVFGLTWLDPSSAQLFGLVSGTKTFPVPSSQGLAGARFHTQVFTILPGGTEVVSSNAVRLHLGG